MNLSEKLKHPIFEIISKVSEQEGKEVYVIGGYVRDLILNRPSPDIDCVVLGSGLEFANSVCRYIERTQNITLALNEFKTFGTAMFKYQGYDIEFVGARKESYSENSRKPSVENGSLEDDQNRRDFTINAMALCLNKGRFGELVDPFYGLYDLDNQIIKTPLDPDITFSDDPLRMFRAIRFATQLYFDIEPDTFAAIERNAHRVEILSKERISEELNKILLSPKPSYGFKLLDVSGLLKLVFPELLALKGVEKIGNKAHKDNFEHTLEVLDNISQVTNNLWLRWAALLHDIAKPKTKRFDNKLGWTFHGHEVIGAKMVYNIFQNFKLPLNEKLKYVQKLVNLHLRPIILAEDIVSDSAIRRLLFDAGDDIDDLMILCKADITSKNREKVLKYRNNFSLVEKKLKEIEEKDRIRNFQPPISGDYIMEYFDLQPCAEIGIIKTRIKDAILDGNIANNREEAYGLMLVIAAELGLKKEKV